MAAYQGFPLLVEGSWGPDPPKNLCTKLQLYFQSSKKSGGGECEVHQEPGSPPRFVVVFFPDDVRQRVLERENHELVLPEKKTFKLTLKLPPAPEKTQKAAERETPGQGSRFEDTIKQSVDASEELNATLSAYEASGNVEAVPDEHESLSTLMVFANLKDSVTDMMLTLLVENISCLSCDDFEVEAFRDLDLAVVRFKKYIDVTKFVDDCVEHPRVKQLQLSARVLEVTQTIRVENLPPGVNPQNLTVFFEDPQNGGGRVATVKCFPEESSALVEFFDRKVLDSIMAKKLELNHMPLSVFPYYHSLDTALYGKEKPLIKLPAPFKETLDLPIWKFLQKNTHLVEEITEEVRRCHCELAWSQLNGEVTIRPSASLVSQGRKKIKSWQKDTSRAFNEIRSKYKVISFKVDSLVWDTMKNALDDNRFLIDFDTLMEILNIVGKSEDIQNLEPQVKQLIESTSQIIEREKQSVKEKVSVSPGKYSLLRHSGVLEHLSSECPEVEMSYDEAAQHMRFKGLPADVYRFKCGVQEKVFAMAQKDLQVSPEIFQFLKETDCTEFSKSLFTAQNILAVYELEAASVLLTSSSPAALLEAEQKMVGALSFKRIDVEDSKVLSDKKWKGFSSSLWRKHNSSSKTVLIRESTSESTAEVIVAGCVRDVHEVHDQLFEFLERHTQIERLVEVKPALLVNYIKNEMKVWQKVKKANMTVTFDHEKTPKGFSLVGPKTEVLKAVELVTQARDSVFVRKIQIDKPGAKQFFQDKQRFCRSEVRTQFGCYIELVGDEAKAGSGSDGQKCFARTTLPSGVSLIVQQGDLTQFPVDVVVNAANEDLKHSGGLAAALLQAAGPELKEYCDQIVKAKGKIPTGSATISKAGRLPYRHVIHAVGPRWRKLEVQRCVDQLRRVVKHCLHLAEEYKYSSIAIPAISSGVFDFPLPQCVETIVLALKEYFQQKSDRHTLKEIYLVDITEKTVEAFADAVKMLFKDTLLESASLPSLPTNVLPDAGKDDGNKKILSTPEGLTILLVEGDVQNARTDVIVNSVASDLVLNRGPLSTALLSKAGPKLQEELSTAGQGNSVQAGTVVQTRGYKLHCSHVLHVVAPSWSKNSTSAHKVMGNIIKTCLKMTESLSLKSITFPAIGTGNLGFPKSVFADLIISEVFKFSSRHPGTSLQEVHFVLHPSDPENIQVFSDEFTKRASGNFSSNKTSQATDAQGFYGAVSNPDTDVYEMKIGSITFQVATGDITKEKADVIVNSTSDTFNLKSGVSKAILEGAGQEVETQCSLQGQQGKRDYIVTDGGSLQCKNIIHVVGGNDVKKSVTSVLQECEQRSYSSVCLPAIGTGSAQQDPGKVAEAVLDALEDFIQKGSNQSVKRVKVIIFLPQLLKVFHDSMKKREEPRASFPQTVLSKVASFLNYIRPSAKKKNPLVLEEKTESSIFQVCGNNVKNVEAALSYIQDIIERELCPYVTQDECIKDFDERECQELNELQKNLNIRIKLDVKKPQIDIIGISRDVFQARNKIEEMLKRVRADKEEGSRADCVSEFIKWQYEDNGVFYCFDKMTNLQLEDAKRAKQSKVHVTINNQTYTVDLSTCTATNRQGQVLQVKRITKSEVEIPAHWSDMKQNNVLVVPLQPADPEYVTVANKFSQTCASFKIEKIERIQNPDLWNSYQAKKKIMDAKNGQIANEKLLFHGTDSASLPYVNTIGFNRSYAGKNAVAFGKGTYFAVDASYSANDTYSRPDANGKKHMYYVRVLTGVYTTGHQSLIVPPPKNAQNPTDLYDTVTDNVKTPKLFVVFYDYQSYPEYLITFRQ